ncbi:MAG: polyprenyl diphosphate synthase [Candidatus Nanoarchaeia archaeon]|nr:polyprenyl diphosphate synthase [Candidatus Nanoarchaeia archaeon]
MKPVKSNVPRHIGIILDGNRRFAKRLMMKPWKGHEFGAEKIEKLMNWAEELKIKEMTLYAFSIENFDRPKEEFNMLMRIFKESFDKVLNRIDEINKKGLRIRFIGRIEMFPEKVYSRMKKIMELTKNNKKYFINFAMAYGGRAEIIDATKKIANEIKKGKLKPEQINEELFGRNLYLNSDPDLIIRTSGEQRISGFLLWQGSYAEFYFIKKLWPEFEKEDLVKAINDYSRRDRRFGKN